MESKKCAGCGKEFVGKIKRQRYCTIQCGHKYQQKKYELNNPEKIKEINKRCKLKNIEKIKEKSKKFREKNRDRLNAQRREWYQKNKLREKEKSALWGIQNKEKRKQTYFVWYEKNKNEIIRRRKQKFPEKLKARSLSERIKIPPGQLCQVCQEELAIQKHHLDYSNPFNLLFVCLRCHIKLHGKEVWA